jgi:hypothetical protein
LIIDTLGDFDAENKSKWSEELFELLFSDQWVEVLNHNASIVANVLLVPGLVVDLNCLPIELFV